jgi:hypothetical protein
MLDSLRKCFCGLVEIVCDGLLFLKWDNGQVNKCEIVEVEILSIPNETGSGS